LGGSGVDAVDGRIMLCHGVAQTTIKPVLTLRGGVFSEHCSHYALLGWAKTTDKKMANISDQHLRYTIMNSNQARPTRQVLFNESALVSLYI
jgi:hypothetical protein